MNMRLCHSACAAVAALSLASAVQASPIVFTAAYDGQSQIVSVEDPSGPVVRVQSVASGAGVLGLDQYFSEDVINLGAGAGAGVSRFLDAAGNELFGAFAVQARADRRAEHVCLDILGLVTFQGGTGRFRHATGWANLVGRGAFIDADTANSRFEFAGELRGVPEPGGLLLLVAGLAALLPAGARRPGRTSTPAGGSPLRHSWLAMMLADIVLSRDVPFRVRNPVAALRRHNWICRESAWANSR